METLIIHPTNKANLTALKAFLSALKISFTVAPEELQLNEITNPETLRSIADWEKNGSAYSFDSIEEIKTALGA